MYGTQHRSFTYFAAIFDTCFSRLFSEGSSEEQAPGLEPEPSEETSSLLHVQSRGAATALDTHAWKLAESRAGITYTEGIRALQCSLAAGLELHKIQAEPHLVLLDPAYYHQHIAIHVARWALLWLHRNLPEDVTLSVSNEVLMEYLCGSVADWTDTAEVKQAKATRNKLTRRELRYAVEHLADGFVSDCVDPT